MNFTQYMEEANRLPWFCLVHALRQHRIGPTSMHATPKCAASTTCCFASNTAPQHDSLAHRGALFDVHGTGELIPVYYNGFRAGEHEQADADHNVAGPRPRHRTDGRPRRSGLRCAPPLRRTPREVSYAT